MVAQHRPGKGLPTLRIALLINGMTGYLQAEFEALRALGHDLLVVTPGSPEVSVGAMVDTAFGDLGTGRVARLHAGRPRPSPRRSSRSSATSTPTQC